MTLTERLFRNAVKLDEKKPEYFARKIHSDFGNVHPAVRIYILIGGVRYSVILTNDFVPDIEDFIENENGTEEKITWDERDLIFAIIENGVVEAYGKTIAKLLDEAAEAIKEAK